MTFKKIIQLVVLIVSLCFILPASAGSKNLIRIATTTSTENSGLLKHLAPIIEKDTGLKLHFIAVGTGKALQMGRDGDVDLMFVHAKKAEEQFVAEGHGVKRHPVMYNDFVIVGPEKYVSIFSNSKTVADVLENIATNEEKFVSRGDDSGTHKKELSLWNMTKLGQNKPSGRWYIEAGQGMGKVLQMAGELGAFTMTDRGTWLAYKKNTPLSIIFEGNSRLFNPYGMIAVNPKKYPDTNFKGAQKFIEWMTSAKGQKMIGNFKISGKVLFIPNAQTKYELKKDDAA